MTDGRRGRQGLEGSWGWLLAASELAARPYSLPASGAGGQVASGRYILTGGNFINSSTNAVTVTMYDGGGTNGQIIGQVTVPASGNFPWTVPHNGLLCEIGVFASPSASAITGALYMVPLWHYGHTAPGT